MPLKSIRAWSGVDALEKHELAPHREMLEALDDLVALRIPHQRRLPGMSRE